MEIIFLTSLIIIVIIFTIISLFNFIILISFIIYNIYLWFFRKNLIIKYTKNKLKYYENKEYLKYILSSIFYFILLINDNFYKLINYSTNNRVCIFLYNKLNKLNIKWKKFKNDKISNLLSNIMKNLFNIMKNNNKNNNENNNEYNNEYNFEKNSDNSEFIYKTNNEKELDNTLEIEIESEKKMNLDTDNDIDNFLIKIDNKFN